MARGLSVYDEAKIQGRLWHPSMLGSDYYVGFSAKDLGNLTITSGSSVDSWIDSSGNGRIVTSVSTKPVFNASKFMGNPCVTFSNSPMDSSATLPAGSNYSWLCLAKDGNPSATISEPFSTGPFVSSVSMEFVLDYDGTSDGGIARSEFMCAFSTSSSARGSSSPIKAIPSLISLGVSSGISQVRINGVTRSATGSNIDTAATRFRLGGSRPQSTFPFNGDIYCFLAVKSVFDSIDYLKSEGWIAWEFGIQSMLSASHPFRNRPPLIGD